MSPSTTFSEEELKEDLDIVWLLLTGYLVFFMQCGFALFEAGTVRLKNVKNILLKNVIDAVAGALVWWAVGFAFAIGSCGDGVFIGHSNFFLADSEATADTLQTRNTFARYFFGWAFSATAATIVGGAMAERMQFRAYISYTIVMSGIAYPVIAYWIWSYGGWLSTKRINCQTGQPDIVLSDGNGVMDFAGSGVVHMVGGTAALVGAIMLGPRIGRFGEDGKVVHFPPNSPAQMTLGVLILWFAWFGFNSGSTGCVLGCMYTAARVAVNTTLSAGAGGATVLLITLFAGTATDIGPILNGILVGLVSITGSCAWVQQYAAVIIGMIGGVIYVLLSKLLVMCRIDDVVDAVPVHLGGGAWGVLASGFFATKTSTQIVLGFAKDWGAFYGGNGTQLGIQILGIVMILVWVTTVFTITFGTLRLMGWLRVTREQEQHGLDLAQGMGSGLSLLNPRNWNA